MDINNLNGVLPDSVFAQIPLVVPRFNINGSLRLAHFLAQCSHESAGFSRTLENMNYSSKGLLQTFPKYFSDDEAVIYARHPEQIGNRAYANRNGNGDELSGDGYRYRGRGYIQLTGKRNYQAFSDFIGEDAITNPDLVATQYPLASAAFFFNNVKTTLWSTCDVGATADVVRCVTKLVNGGTLGLPERVQYFVKFYNLLR